jgi:hypothetical protein
MRRRRLLGKRKVLGEAMMIPTTFAEPTIPYMVIGDQVQPSTLTNYSNIEAHPASAVGLVEKTAGSNYGSSVSTSVA